MLGHQRPDLIEIVGVDGLFEPSGVLQPVDIGLEFGPTGVTVDLGDPELGVGEGLRTAGLKQSSGLVFEMAEIGTFRKRAQYASGRVRHRRTPFKQMPAVRNPDPRERAAANWSGPGAAALRNCVPPRNC
jgi:hypothetical protein